MQVVPHAERHRAGHDVDDPCPSRPCALRAATARAHRNEPVTLTARTGSHSSSGISSNGRILRLEKIAALLISTSMRPNSASDRARPAPPRSPGRRHRSGPRGPGRPAALISAATRSAASPLSSAMHGDGAGGGELAGVLAADALAASGDQDDAVADVEVAACARLRRAARQCGHVGVAHRVPRRLGRVMRAWRGGAAAVGGCYLCERRGIGMSMRQVSVGAQQLPTRIGPSSVSTATTMYGTAAAGKYWR